MNRSARVDDSVMTTSLRDTGCEDIARNWSYIGHDTFIESDLAGGSKSSDPPDDSGGRLSHPQVGAGADCQLAPCRSAARTMDFDNCAGLSQTQAIPAIA